MGTFYWIFVFLGLATGYAQAIDVTDYRIRWWPEDASYTQFTIHLCVEPCPAFDAFSVPWNNGVNFSRSTACSTSPCEGISSISDPAPNTIAEYSFIATGVDVSGNRGPPSNKITIQVAGDVVPTTTLPSPTTSTTTTLPSPTTSSTRVVTSTSLPATTSTTVEAALVAAYSFNDTSADSSVNRLHGTAAALGTLPLYINGAFRCAADTTFTVPDDNLLDFTSDFSITARVTPSSSGGYAIIVSKTDAGNPVNYYLGLYNRNVDFGYYNNGWLECSGPTIALNQTTHIGVTFTSPATVRLYTSGVLRTTCTFARPPLVNDGPLRLCRSYASEIFTGAVDDLRLYRSVLSAPQIVQDMNTPVASPIAQSTTSTSSSSSSSSIPTTSSSVSSSATSTSTSTTIGCYRGDDGLYYPVL